MINIYIANITPKMFTNYGIHNIHPLFGTRITYNVRVSHTTDFINVIGKVFQSIDHP